MKLPAWLLSIIQTMILPLAKLLGKNGLVEVLNNQKEKNPNLYRSIIIVGYRIFKVDLKILADKTPQIWDNDAIDLVASAIEKSAADNGVPLPDVTIIPALPPTPPVI